MLFKQWAKVIDGTKTETRRLKQEGHRAAFQHGLYETLEIVAVLDVTRTSHKTVYRVGKLFPVVPGRGKHAIWFLGSTPRATFLIENGHAPEAVANLKATLTEHGFRQANICLTVIREQRLQDITHEEALREGVSSVDEYRALWEELHTMRGRRWHDNPVVWALTFRLVVE